MNTKIDKAVYSGTEYLQFHDYWDTTFSNIDEAFIFKMDNTGLPEQTSDEFLRDSRICGKKSSASIDQLSKKNPFNECVLFCAAFSFLLARYTGKKQVVLNTPLLTSEDVHEDRTNDQVTMLFDIPDQVSIKDFIISVKNRLTNSYAYQDYPMELLDMQERTMEQSVTNVAFCFPLLHDCFSSSSSADFTLSVCRSNSGQIEMVANYNAAIFGEQFVNNFLHNLETCIEKFDDLEIDFHYLEYLPDEQVDLLSGFHPKQASYAPMTVSALFELQVKCTPNSVAIVTENALVTYSELNHGANQFASLLRDKYNIASGDLVGVFLEGTEHTVMTLLAILKAGAAYVPLDTAYPQKRLAFILQDVAPKVLITQSHLLTGLDFYNGEIFAIDIQYDQVAHFPIDDLVNVNGILDLAYIMYTSGSTGEPKGVMIEHKSIVRLVKNTNYISFNPGDKLLQTGSLSFDASTFEIWGTLLNGGELHLLSYQSLLDTTSLKAYVDKTGIDYIFMTSSWFNELVSTGIGVFENIRTVFTGGDRLSAKHINAWKSAYPDKTIFNVYGPTENTTFSTFFLIDRLFENNIPIGKAIANTQVYILDERQQLLPIGVAGELCLGGDGLSRGYRNMPHLTAQKFVSNTRVKRLYRSGDLAKLLPDGNIVFLGRKDDQVKVRGFRIELSEIRERLTVFGEILDAVVEVTDDVNDMKSITAYFTSKVKENTTAIQHYLRSELPAYMVPAYYVQLEKFPLNRNGKIDKTALPRAQSALIEVISDSKPLSVLEATLIQIWKEVLCCEVSKTDNFFSSGGDSIKAIRLISLVNKTLHRSLEVKDIFIHQDVRSLANYLEVDGCRIESEIHKEATDAINAIADAILSDPGKKAKLPLDLWEMYPMSDIQVGMIFHGLKEKELCIYIDQVFYQIEDPSFDFNLFRDAFSFLVKRHSTLRTSFDINEFSCPIQIVHENCDVHAKMNLMSLESIPEEDHRRYLEEYLISDRAKGFPIEVAGLWRMVVFKMHSENYGILWSFHHAIIDGWSNSSLLTELSHIYSELKKGGVYDIRPLKASYKDYIIDQYKLKRTTTHQEYWANYLEGYIRTQLPFNRMRKAKKRSSSAIKVMSLGKFITESVQQLAIELSVGVNDIYLSAFCYLISLTTNTRDLTIGLVTNGRPAIEDGDKIAGCFLNTIPFRINVLDDVCPADFILGIAAHHSSLKEYDKFPLKEIIQATGQPLSEGNGLFDIIFSYLDFHITNETHRDVVSKRPLIESFVRANTLFDFIVGKEGDEAKVQLFYPRDEYSVVELDRITSYYFSILECFISQPHVGSLKMSILPSHEQQMLLHDFNQTFVDYDREKSISQLFNEQVRLSPDSIALVSENEILTYHQLDVRSNQLANYLRSVIGDSSPGSIGLLSERNAWSVIAILAIVKAGASYVPLEISSPEQRLKQIVNQVGLLLLVVDDGLHARPFEKICRCVALSESWQAIETCGREVIGNVNTAESLAYIMYTSGSTGVPKGVMVPHRGVIRLVKNCHYAPLGIGSSLLQTGSIAFDASTFEIWGMLLNGGTLHTINKLSLLDSSNLESYLRDHEISMMWFTTGWFNQLVEERLAIFSFLKTIIVGGEKLSSQHIATVRHQYPLVKIINGYGPTENTTFSLTYTISDNWHGEVPLGKPITNSEVYVLDENLKLLPIGVIGEICVAGEGLALGYLNQEELTQEKFKDHPFVPKSKIYCTGDLGYWREDGTVQFAGRKDDQIKIRGYRIEPGEIESLLLKQDEVIDAKVVVNKYDIGKEVVAYVILRSGVSLNSIKDFLTTQLPPYMLPRRFVLVSEFPLTSNGKVDKYKLSLITPPEDSNSLVAPSNDIEEKLMLIWSELLEKKTFGVSDNFFELGGHSLTASRLVYRIEKEFGIKIDLRCIFEIPTITAISKKILSGKQTLYVPIGQAPVQDSYEVTNSQKRLWVIHQMEDVKFAYNVHGALIFNGTLDLDSFGKTFDALSRRHESLRTTFDLENGALRQFVHDSSYHGFPFEFIDASHLDNATQFGTESAMREAQTIFDLVNGPLAKAVVIQLANDRHLFLFTLHHIIADGWSIEVILDEITQLYTSYTQNRVTNLPPLTIQYKDFAAWQNAKVMNVHRHYWTNRLADAPVLNLPMDFIRQANRRMRGDRVEKVLDTSLIDGMKALGNRTGSTLYMVLLAAVKALLHRYSGQQDIVVGTPIAGRDHLDLENQVGVYLNNLCLRTFFSPDDSFDSLLANIRQVTLEAYEHSLYPYDQLVEDLNENQATNRSSLFDVVVVLQNTKMNSPNHSIDGVKIERFDVSHRVSVVDLRIEFTPVDEGLLLVAEFDTDLFTRNRIERLVNHYVELVRSILVDSKQKIGALKFLTSNELELFSQCHQVEASCPTDKTMVNLWEEQVAKTPNAIALIYGDQNITYSVLNARANRLAYYLRTECEVGVHDVVGLMMDRSDEMMVGVLGILKSGAAYLPIDPAYPGSRINYMLTDAKVKVLITESTHMFTAPFYQGKLIVFDIQEASFSEQSDNLPILSKSTDLAYVIYTSGSTGSPKGVMIEHGSNINMAYDQIRQFGIQPTDRVLQFASLSFDASVSELCMAWYSGATLILTDQSTIQDAQRFKEFIEQNEVHIVTLPPSYLSSVNLKDVKSLKTIITAGEAAHPSTAFEYSSRLNYFNAYGPTECAVCVSIFRVTSEDSWRSIIPIGKPITNTRVYVLDANLQIVPMGVDGQIFVGGAGLARGYFEKEHLTAEKFIANPYEPGQRMYCTGDIGRWLESGDLEFRGRSDDQLKIRGFRVEPGEIKNVLLKNPIVKDVAVVAGKDSSGENFLIAYILSDKTGDDFDWQNELAQFLPGYMIPSYFIRMDHFPITINGKIDYGLLPMPLEGLRVSEKYTLPQNQLEEKLIQIWKDILLKECIGTRDNFFRLGGHSLKAIQLASRIQLAFGVKIEIKNIFSFPTILQQAAFIADQVPEEQAEIVPVAAASSYDLSHAQKRLWVLNQLEDKQIVYNVPASYRIKGKLDIDAFEKALYAIVERHESLRSSFIEIDGKPQQVIQTLDVMPFRIHYHDFRLRSEKDLLVAQAANSETQTVFDLERGLLIRATLIQIEDDEYVFLLTMHHIVSDGWSMIVFVKELGILYNAFIQGHINPLKPLSIQYKDFAHWQNDIVIRNDHEKFWLEKFKEGIDFVAFQYDYARETYNKFNGAHETLLLPANVVRELKKMANDNNATLSTILFTLFNTLLYRLTGQKKITVALTEANRNFPSAENLIGYFVNFLVIKTELSENISLEELTQEVNTSIGEALEHQNYPFDLLVERLSPVRHANFQPLINVAFTYQSQLDLNVRLDIKSDSPNNSDQMEDIKVTEYAFEKKKVTAKFDLILFANEQSDEVQMTFEYNTDLFKQTTMKKYVQYFERIINAVVKK